MGFSLWHLFKSVVLFINAVAILNEDRFLARIGWARSSMEAGYGEEAKSFKTQAITLISSVQTLLKIPLIAINSFLILFELVFG